MRNEAVMDAEVIEQAAGLMAPGAREPPDLHPLPPSGKLDALLEEAEHAALLGRHHRGANWFLWIAGLTVINSVMVLRGSHWHFLFALGITQLVDIVGLTLASTLPQAYGVVLTFALLVNIVIASSMVFLGLQARRYNRWGYVVGMGLYLCDGVVFALCGDYPAALFHALALVMIFRGFRACRRLDGAFTAGARRAPGGQG